MFVWISLKEAELVQAKDREIAEAQQQIQVSLRVCRFIVLTNMSVQAMEIALQELKEKVSSLLTSSAHMNSKGYYGNWSVYVLGLKVTPMV